MEIVSTSVGERRIRVTNARSLQVYYHRWCCGFHQQDNVCKFGATALLRSHKVKGETDRENGCRRTRATLRREIRHLLSARFFSGMPVGNIIACDGQDRGVGQQP